MVKSALTLATAFLAASLALAGDCRRAAYAYGYARVATVAVPLAAPSYCDTPAPADTPVAPLAVAAPAYAAPVALAVPSYGYANVAFATANYGYHAAAVRQVRVVHEVREVREVRTARRGGRAATGAGAGLLGFVENAFGTADRLVGGNGDGNFLRGAITARFLPGGGGFRFKGK
jgi:hypothetical protein